MRIRGQRWKENKKHIVITLHQPYWGAWKKYGWDYGVEGMGIAPEAIEKAREMGKKLKVNVTKYGSYEITPLRCEPFMKYIFIARDFKKLIVIPRTAFDKLK